MVKLTIDRSGTTTLLMPQVEVGQGVYTSISMIHAPPVRGFNDPIELFAYHG
jgi:hypothetical protein